MINKKILLAIDFSDRSKLLLNRIDEFERIGIEEITLVNIVDVKRTGMSSLEAKKRNQEKLKKLKEKLDRTSLSIKTITKAGFPAEEIVNIAANQGTMIHIASKGESFLKRSVIGSTIHDVIRLAKTPVLVEKFTTNKKGVETLTPDKLFKKILIPVDFSSYCNRLIESIKEGNIPNKEIVLITVIENSRDKKDLKKRKYRIDKKLKMIKKELEKVSDTVSFTVQEGTASDRIAEVSDKEDVDLIIIPSRGRGRIKNLLIGSTAEAVVKKSNRPVLLIPVKNKK